MQIVFLIIAMQIVFLIVAMQMSHETSAPFNVQIDEGYGGQGYSSQGQGYTSQGFSGQIYSTQGYAGQSQGYVNQDYGQSSYQQEEKEETGGFLSWFTSGSVVSKVMEKAKVKFTLYYWLYVLLLSHSNYSSSYVQL